MCHYVVSPIPWVATGRRRGHSEEETLSPRPPPPPSLYNILSSHHQRDICLSVGGSDQHPQNTLWALMSRSANLARPAAAPPPRPYCPRALPASLPHPPHPRPSALSLELLHLPSLCICPALSRLSPGPRTSTSAWPLDLNGRSQHVLALGSHAPRAEPAPCPRPPLDPSSCLSV